MQKEGKGIKGEESEGRPAEGFVFAARRCALWSMGTRVEVPIGV